MPCTPNSPYLFVPGTVPIEVDNTGQLFVVADTPRNMLLCGGDDGFITVFMPDIEDVLNDRQDQFYLAADLDINRITVRNYDDTFTIVEFAPVDPIVPPGGQGSITLVKTASDPAKPDTQNTIWKLGEPYLTVDSVLRAYELDPPLPPIP